MIRHGQSVANRDGYFSGNIDVELTDLGKEQAVKARAHVEALETKPVRIIHSHLQRARHTAEIINENLKLPMHETPLLGEHRFGDWENRPKSVIHPRFFSNENPPNGETHDAFTTRARMGINHALSFEGLALITCHGGVFRAFSQLYGQEGDSENCVLYEFTPHEATPNFPWKIKMVP